MKKRKREHSPPSPPMRGGVSPARALKALRSVEVAKLRKDIINVYNQEVIKHVHDATHKSRPAGSKSLAQPPSQRRVPSEFELRKSRLPTQVRHELSDAKRVLVCAKRNIRKEIIFALQRAGKRGNGNKKAKWTDDSYLRCK